MLDLETYGTGVDALIREIAIVPFTLTPLRIYSGAELDFYPSREEQLLQLNRKVDDKTVAWWASKKDTDIYLSKLQVLNLKACETVALTISHTLTRLKEKYNVYIVGRGASSFDYPILKNFLEQLGCQFDVPFYRILDLRTLTSVFKIVSGRDIVKEVGNEGYHIGINDCYAQIKQMFEVCIKFGAVIPAIDQDYFTTIDQLCEDGKD